MTEKTQCEALLEIRDLSVAFEVDEGEVQALDGVSLEVGQGQTLGLVGESGCGKSVTALSVMRLLPKPMGKVLSAPVGSVFYTNQTAIGIMAHAVTRLADFPSHSLRFHNSAIPGNQGYRATGQSRESPRLININMAVLLSYDFVTRLGVGADRNRIGHRAARNQQASLLAHDGCHSILQFNDRWVFSEHVISKLCGAKVIVFSQFTSFLSILKKNIRLSLPDLQVLELTGSTRDRSLPVETFESSNGPTVLLASLKAAGLGVTLKSADYVFLMDPWWNPAVEEQAIDRAHRLGREKPTFIYRLVAQGTIEERVRNLQVEKKETFQKIIGEIEKPTGLVDHFSSLKDLIELKEN